MGGERMALVENRKTRVGKYLSVGDAVEGATVSAIDEKSISLQLGGSPHSLALNTDYKLVPLARSADYLTQNANGAPGTPGAPGAGGIPGMPGMPGAPNGAGSPGGGR